MPRKTEFELERALQKILDIVPHDPIEPMGKCPHCIAFDALQVLRGGKPHYERILDAEQFHQEKIVPNLADKLFIAPAWALDFAEKYAEYKVSAFYRLKLKLEMEEWERMLFRVLGR